MQLASGRHRVRTVSRVRSLKRTAPGTSSWSAVRRIEAHLGARELSVWLYCYSGTLLHLVNLLMIRLVFHLHNHIDDCYCIPIRALIS